MCKLICTLLLMLLFIININGVHSSNTFLSKTIISKNKVSLFDATVQLIMNVMSTCYPDHLDKVVFVGEWAEFQNWHQLFEKNVSTNIIGLSESIMFDRHKRVIGVYKINEDIVRKLRYPAKLFVVSAAFESLNKTLMRLQKSIFWQAEATFFIASSEVSCSRAKYWLHSVWMFNALYVLYICHDGDGLYVYSFNPFASYASESWKKVDSINDEKRNRSLSIFRLSGNFKHIDKSICSALDYCKTEILDGYPIAISGALVPGMLTLSSTSFSNQSPHYRVSDFGGVDGKLTQAIWSKFGASPTVTILEEGYVDAETHEPRGSLKYIMRGDYDMGINEYYFRSFWRLQTYPHVDGGTCVMTKETFQTMAVISMSGLLEPLVLSTVIVVTTMVAVMLKYVLKIDIVLAFLKAWKILLGMPTKHQPPTIDKLYVVYFILLMNCMNMYLQSSLTSSLAVPRNTFYVDSRDDLIAVANDYEICGPAYVKEFLDDNLIDQFIEMPFVKCLEKLQMNDKVACLGDCFLVNHYAKDCEYCHISKYIIQNMSLAFIVREDWPLKTRFNVLVQRLREAGVTTHILKDELVVVKDHRKMHETRRMDRLDGEDVRKVALDTLDFIFHIILGGVIMSIFAFAGEFVVNSIDRSRKKRIVKRKLNKLKILNRR